MNQLLFAGIAIGVVGAIVGMILLRKFGQEMDSLRGQRARRKAWDKSH